MTTIEPRSRAALKLYRNVLEDRLLFLNIRDGLLQVGVLCQTLKGFEEQILCSLARSLSLSLSLSLVLATLANQKSRSRSNSNGWVGEMGSHDWCCALFI